MYTIPPSYLSRFVVPTLGGSPANLLINGDWCGHGEPLFGVYDVRANGNGLISVQLPSSREWPELVAITAVISTQEPFFLYDPRKHPTSFYAVETREYEYKPAAPFSCPSCGGKSFTAAVGFEMPSDSHGPDDASWFALAVECSECKWQDIIFYDEIS